MIWFASLTSGVDPRVKAAWVGVVGILVTVLVTIGLEYSRQRHEAAVIVTAVRSDIRALVEALGSVQIVSGLDEVAKTGDIKTLLLVVPSEDYFQLFNQTSSQLGKLDEKFVQEAVRFYTALKVSRVLAGPLYESRRTGKPISDAPPETIKLQALRVLTALDTALLAGEKILCSDPLVDDCPTSALRKLTHPAAITLEKRMLPINTGK